MFTVYHSNQLDILKTLIAELIERAPLADPFSSEVILVQSPGMAQWLQIQLAEHFSIAANLEFPLPATFIWTMFTRVMPEIPKESAYSKDAMTWKLMQLLPEQLLQPALEPLKDYLLNDAEGRKTYQLAARVADLFDQYLVYRPEWLEAWQQGKLIAGLDNAQQWQAQLWRELIARTKQLGQPEWHRANLYQRFIHTLEQAKTVPHGLPKRVFICGIAALPPVYLQALQALSQHIDIHLMFTNPCRWYWADIQDYAFLSKLQNRQRQRYQQQQTQPLFRELSQSIHLFDEQGVQRLNNPLLASWGKQGRDNLYLLMQHNIDHEIDAFVEIPSTCLLHRIQRDILELQDNTVIGAGIEQLKTSETKQCLLVQDRSLSVHLCHSPQREVEVLHDYLLRLFDSDPQLTPREVIVMMADIDSYTPYIQAVFGSAPATRYLPFAISDRNARQAQPILQAFISLLQLPKSRFTAESVLALLEVPALAARFMIDEQGLRLLRQWVEEAGVRWGLDDDTLSALDLPPTGQHTWKFGLTRMLLGYAMESEQGDWQGVLPFDETRGLAAEWAGKLADFLMQLEIWRANLAQARTLAEWQPLCGELLAAFFERDAEMDIVATVIEQQWQKIIVHGLDSHYDKPVSLVVLYDELVARLDSERISQRFLAGPINFCTLMPMRAIPFHTVCLLGMNDGVYPRTVLPLGFDLMANQVQRGDRSRRNDDRYLFLEALLSAQKNLYISYIGRSIQDDSECYPSVLVSELVEYITQSHYLQGDQLLSAEESAERVRAHLLCQHSRMPFSEDNYQPHTEWQSYAAEWLPAAQRVGTAAADFGQRLPKLICESLSLEQLCRFYRHPIRFFFQQRLGVYFVLEETELPDQEPFVLDDLSRYHLNQQLLENLLAGKTSQQIFQQFSTAGRLPHGAFGQLYWQQQQSEVALLAQRVLQETQPTYAIDVEIKIEGIQLTGLLAKVQDDGLLRARAAKLNMNDGVRLWIEHLVYCTQGGAGESRMYGLNQSCWRFAPQTVTQAQQQLTQLLQGYQQGMNQPLLLPPKTAMAWIETLFDKKSGQLLDEDAVQSRKAHDKLLHAWQGDQRITGEASDPYIQRLLPEITEKTLEQIMLAAKSYLLPVLQHQIR